MNKRGQVSVFVIVALVIVAGIVLYFSFREQIGGEQVPAELMSVFDYYHSCIENEAKTAALLAGEGGGRIKVEDYTPGSEYAPFSSHLNFLGSPVKYWYYVSGNGLIKEQVPTKQEMEKEMADYIEEGLKRCDFEYYFRQGFEVEASEPSVEVDVYNRKVEVKVSAELIVSKEDETARKDSHNAEINSKLGKFYNLALEIYTEEKKEMFLEKYGVDVLYNYAPVDGVEIQCAPKIWLTRKVMVDLKSGLDENFRTIKFKGSYYELQGEDREYFVWDKPVDEAVQVVYSKDWPTKIEIYGDGVDDEIMISEAVGTQAGMGVMGFCYVPYHFVYDVSFPALIQIYDVEELFQFPVVVVIDKNMPRNSLVSEMPLGEEEEFDLCEFKTEEVVVNIYDVNLNKVDANVSYGCFNQKCRLGESKGGTLRSVAPACVNGYLHLRAEGYTEKKQLFSTNEEKFADIVLEREYEVEVDLRVGGSDLDGTAIVSFVREDGKSVTAALPEMREVKLSEGSYEINVYVYGNSSIVIPASTKTECAEVPREGLLGFFGSTTEKCLDITIPKTKIEHALIGGGVLKTYLFESDLEKGHVALSVDRFAMPNSIEDLSQNFELFESKRVGVEFMEEGA